MAILDANTLAAAQSVTLGTLDDSCSIYSPSSVDNGLGSETVYGLRDVQKCRVTDLPDTDVSDSLRLLKKTLYRLTLPSSATLFLGERVVITGTANLTAYVEDINTPQTDALVGLFAIISKAV